MNVLLTNATGIFAGGEDYVLILARYLRLRGHSVFVAARPGHLLLTKCGAAGIPAIPVAFEGMSRVFSVGMELRRHLRTHAIDVVHSNANYDRTCAAIAAGMSPVVHIAGVHSAHSIQHNLTHWIRNRRGTQHFIADADAVRDVLIREDGIDPDRITVVPIGVEHEPADVQAEARVRTRSAWQIAPETLVIGNVARLVPFKGQTHLLDAIARVVKDHTNVVFPIIGDGELRDALERQADDLGIAPYVRFLGFQDNLHEIYPAFDIYCHSSLELAAEAFPLAILRALATGLAVVCTKVGGIGLMVEDGVSGRLTPPAEPAALAEALIQVIRDPALRRGMGQASFRLFLKSFHASAMAESVEGVYLRARHAVPATGQVPVRHHSEHSHTA